jgi:hypothetical protein
MGLRNASWCRCGGATIDSSCGNGLGAYKRSMLGAFANAFTMFILAFCSILVIKSVV